MTARYMRCWHLWLDLELSEQGLIESWAKPGSPLCPRLGSKADINAVLIDVCFVPKADICSAANSRLFDDLIGNSEHLGRDVEA